jgi:hypothetical protein
MSAKRIKEIVAHLIMTQQNIDNWQEYRSNIILNFNLIDFRKVIENYKPCAFSKLYISKDRMAKILYENIQQNDNLFVELFKGGRYPRQECDFTGNDTWALIEECVHILVQKQTCAQ